jgi:hypothetical protein
LPRVRKKQPAWRKDTVGWPKSWPPRKPNANVIAPWWRGGAASPAVRPRPHAVKAECTVSMAAVRDFGE